MRAKATLLGLVTLSLVGCGSSDTAKSSPEEVKSFKGGPMPQEFKDKLAAQKSAKPGQ